MDGTVTMKRIREEFRTPMAILVPKLLKGRDDWKAKSHARKAQIKKLKITIRDVTVSRDRWRMDFEQSKAGKAQLQQQLDAKQRELTQALARAEGMAVKKNG